LPQSLQKGTPSMDSKKYVGMNVHKESISIAVMNGAGKIVMECVIETKASMILQFIDGLRGDLQVTFEQGTSAAWLYDLLKPVLRQNAIRAENGAILFCHGGDKEPALDQEFLAAFLRRQLHSRTQGRAFHRPHVGGPRDLDRRI